LGNKKIHSVYKIHEYDDILNKYVERKKEIKMNYYDLASTTPDVLEKIKIAEKEGRFSDHLDPIDYSHCLPVDGNFKFLYDWKTKFVYWWRNVYFLRWFNWILNRCIFKTKIVGKENLKGVKAAVVTCNHINKFDGLVVGYVLKHKKMRIMVADFNNHKGFLGKQMRAYGILPFSPQRDANRNFQKAITWYLHNDHKVLFFPEGSEWWCYEKPRPFMDGAFHYAAGNNVPILPMFITFKKSGKFDKNGIEQRHFTVHIMKPIYPNPDLSKHDNTSMLKEKNYEECCKKYEEIYGKPVTE
jgi:1-acyl-sn-glycerol-3-phosphate acyltransferase